MRVLERRLDNGKNIRFLKNEFLTLSLFGALGRSKTYRETVSEKKRADFRSALRKKLENIASRYGQRVDDATHLDNLCEIADDMTLRFSNLLKNGLFRIGIAQKCLNLYLKYLWCAGKIPEPPHCPFDSVVIAHLPRKLRLNWTEIGTIQEYEQLVNAARTVAGNKSLAEWELSAWAPRT